MSSATPQDNSPKDEVPLEDIDRLLAEEDPEFTKSLEEVRAVEIDKNVVIEATVIDETLGEETAVIAEDEKVGRFKKALHQIRAKITSLRHGFRARLIQFGKDALVWLKVRPKEYALFALALSIQVYGRLKVPAKSFAQAPRLVQLSIFILIGVMVAVFWVFKANLKGIWIPHLMDPILTSLEPKADFVETYDPKAGTESFYAAFPQEVHEFLFKKMKVNLRRTAENPLPMGAFEVVVEVDSKDTAVELRDREVEFHDLLQRLFEDELVTQLDGETGKKVLKGRIRKELNAKLTQGWIKDIHFKTFVLKP